MNLVDDDLLQEFRDAPSCEWCGRQNYGQLDPAHVLSRGAGRVDLWVNVVSLCRECHAKNHNGNEPTMDQLLGVVCRRMNPDAIKQMVWQLRRYPKEATR